MLNNAPESRHPDQDVRGRGLSPGLPQPPGLVHPGAAELPDRQGALSRHLQVHGRLPPG